MRGRSENFHFKGGMGGGDLPYEGGGVSFLGGSSYPSGYYGLIVTKNIFSGGVEWNQPCERS